MILTTCPYNIYLGVPNVCTKNTLGIQMLRHASGSTPLLRLKILHYQQMLLKGYTNVLQN